MTAITKTRKTKKQASPGKVFEADILASAPPDAFAYRIKDDVGKFKGVNNPADMILFHSGRLIVLELKTVKIKRIPCENIRPHQFEGLAEFDALPGVSAGFLFNFREIEGNPTFFIHATDIEEERKTGVKSFSFDYCQRVGTPIASTFDGKRHHYELSPLYN